MIIYCQQAVCLHLYLTSISSLSAMGDSSGGSGGWKTEHFQLTYFDQPPKCFLFVLEEMWSPSERNTACLF